MEFWCKDKPHLAELCCIFKCQPHSREGRVKGQEGDGGVSVRWGVCALRLGQIPKGLLLFPAMTAAADGLSLIVNIYLCSRSSVVCFWRTW